MPYLSKEQLVGYFKEHKQEFADSYGVIGVGLQIVWNTIQSDLSQLLAALRMMVEL